MTGAADTLSGLRERVLRRVLGRLAELLFRFCDDAAKCGDRHRVGDTMAAAETLIRLVDALKAVSDTLVESSAATQDATFSNALQTIHVRLAGSFDEIANAQEHRDTVRIADILEYDVVPLSSRLATLVQRYLSSD